MSEIENTYATILERMQNPEPGSYTNYLLDKGMDKILKKVGEESTEVIIAALSQSNEDLIGELNDLVYHVLVLMAARGITIEQVEEVMAKRAEKTHNLKPERKPITNL